MARLRSGRVTRGGVTSATGGGRDPLSSRSEGTRSPPESDRASVSAYVQPASGTQSQPVGERRGQHDPIQGPEVRVRTCCCLIDVACNHTMIRSVVHSSSTYRSSRHLVPLSSTSSRSRSRDSNRCDDALQCCTDHASVCFVSVTRSAMSCRRAAISAAGHRRAQRSPPGDSVSDRYMRDVTVVQASAQAHPTKVQACTSA